MNVREAGEADVAAIAEIYAHHVRHGLASFEEAPPDVAEMGRRMSAVKAHGLPYVVAEADGRVLGYAYASAFRPRAAYRYTVEDSVYVAPDAVGRGVGRATLTAVLETLEAQGLRQVIAVIGDSENHASIGLHHALGFEHVGVLKAVGFKFGRWVDSVWMQKALNGGEASLPAAPGLILG